MITVRLRDIDQLDDLVAEPRRSGIEQQVVAAHPHRFGTTGDDLVGRPQARLGLRRTGGRPALQPVEFAPGEDPPGRLLARRLHVAGGTTREIRGVGAGARDGAVDVPLTALDLDDPTLTSGRGETVHQMTVMGDHHQCRLGSGQPLFEPFDRLEVEVVGGLVEHDHVELSDESARQRDTFGLAT